MNDRERDPVAWGHMQDAGRVAGLAAAKDRLEVCRECGCTEDEHKCGPEGDAA